MKKSEAVKVVEKVLLDHFGDLTNRVAKDVIDALEKVGMKPPLTKRCPVLLTQIHTWEDEKNGI